MKNFNSYNSYIVLDFKSELIPIQLTAYFCKTTHCKYKKCGILLSKNPNSNRARYSARPSKAKKYLSCAPVQRFLVAVQYARTKVFQWKMAGYSMMK